MGRHKLTKAEREAAIEARRAYKRDWAHRNPDKVKEYQDRYWANKARRSEQGGGDAA